MLWSGTFRNRLRRLAGRPGFAAALAALLIMTCALMLPPVIGVADNGDFFRAANGLGIYKLDRYEEDQFFNYAATKFGIYEYYNQYGASIPSSQIFFIQAALVLDRVFTGDAPVFDIRFLGGILMLYAALAIFLLTEYVAFGRSRKEGILLACVCVFLFADTGYTAYFNSFFTEGLVYVSFLTAMASALLMIQRKRFFVPLYLSVIVNGAITVWAKQQNATVGLVFFLMCLILGCFLPREEKKKKIAWAVGGGFLLLCAAAVYLVIPETYKNINQYHTMTRGVMMEAENPEEAADFFGMNRQYTILNESVYFERYPSVDPDDEILKEEFYEKYNFVSVCIWYLSHPDALMRMLTDAAQEGYIIQPDMLGNYDRSAGKPPGTKTDFFTVYSRLKRKLAPTTVGFVLVWMLLITGLNLHDRKKLFLVWCIIAAGLIQVGTSVVGAGDTDLSKHVFLYNVAFDLVTFISIAPGIVGLARWLYRLFPRKRRRAACIFLVAAVSLTVPMKSEASQVRTEGKREEKVLIVCGAERDAAFLQAITGALGTGVDVVTGSAYTDGQAGGYDFVITTSPVCMEDIKRGGMAALCLKDACSQEDVPLTEKRNSGVAFSFGEWSEPPRRETRVRYLAEPGDPSMGLLKIGEETEAPFLQRDGKLAYIPFYREDGLGAVMLGNAVGDLLGIKGEGAMYAAIDEVYPFSDLAKLCRMADILHDNGIPFIVRVMPVYDNLDYPAFLRYAQVLRYVQARNGTVMVHPPIERGSEEGEETLETKMGRFTDALGEQGILWISMEDTPFQMEWGELRDITSAGKNFGVFPFPCMFTIPVEISSDAFLKTVELINAKWLSLSDYKAAFTGESFVYREEMVQAEFSQEEETQQAVFADFFAKSDKILMVLVSFGLIIFLVLIGVGAKWYRRKFLRDDRRT